MADKKITASDYIDVNEQQQENAAHIHGHVTIKEKGTDRVILDKENLVTQRTRVWLFEQLFKTKPSSDYAGGVKVNNNRQIYLMSVGSGGSDLNAAAFAPYVPVFSDTDLGQKVPFISTNPDKDNDTRLNGNPSIVKTLSDDQKHKYYMTVNNPDGSVNYFAKRPDNSTTDKPYGTSKGWNINKFTGEVSFTISFSISRTECRGSIINEIGLWLAEYNSSSNTFKDPELATRICFDPESLSSLTKELEIEYTLYI